MPRTMSTDSMTLNSMSAGSGYYDQMDPEVRAQIQSNIHVIYEPSIAPQVHIATCRSIDGSFMAFLVMHGNLIKAVWNPNLLAGEGRHTRSSALLSLLEATEDRIRDMLLKTNEKEMAKKVNTTDKRQSMQTVHQMPNNEKKVERKAVQNPTSDTTSELSSVDYSIRPKEKSFMPWRKSTRSESLYTRVD